MKKKKTPKIKEVEIQLDVLIETLEQQKERHQKMFAEMIEKEIEIFGFPLTVWPPSNLKRFTAT